MAEDKFFNERVSYDADYDPRFAPRFAEIATFMRAPYRPDLAGVDIGVCGVPYDGGATNRAGARHGPRAVRDLSTLMRNIHHVSRINPFSLARVADVGDARLNSLFDNASAEKDLVAFFSRFAAAGVTPLTIGGDHSITYAILKGVVRQGPVGLIHIDAHTDVLGPIQGVRFHHASPFRNAIEDGLVDPARMVQIGIRGAHNTPEAWEFCARHGIRVIYIEEFDALGVAKTVEIARAIVGAGPRLSVLRHRRARPLHRARHRHAGGGRADDARGAGAGAGPARARSHRRRRGGGLAAVRSRDQHRALRGDDGL